ncbi:MAG: response regulator transcription factor [Acidimicrobiales bacterium]|nr:response regulator transcription factor [Actinomycetota bacterium]
MGRRILFIEDDDHMRAMLCLSLEQEGYTVVEARSGEEGLRRLEDGGADMVLVDLRLPDMDGFEVTRAIRRLTNIPIAMVTASGDTHDVVAGLEAGADDYVVKPVVAKELSARIRALLRRSATQPATDTTVERFGDIELHREAGVVRRDGNEVPLTLTQFRVFCELANTPGWVVSRSQLLERVWGYDFFGDDRLVDYHISGLRTKVERDPSNPELIVTVRGLGYKLVP